MVFAHRSAAHCQPWNIKNQGDLAIAEDSCAGESWQLLLIGFEALDDDLLLTEQVVNKKADMAAFGLNDDKDALI